MSDRTGRLRGMTSVDPRALSKRLTRERPLAPGSSWVCTLHRRLPGWYSAVAHDEEGDPYIGGLALYGPGGRCLELSSNPLIHGSAECVSVVSELAQTDISDEDLVREIRMRTEQRQSR